MFEKEIEELFKLSMRVANETPAFVEFDVLSHVHICHINIMDAGWDKMGVKDIALMEQCLRFL